MDQVKLDRRSFLVSAAAFGGGMALSIIAPKGALAATMNSKPWVKANDASEFSPWVAITADDEVIIRVPTPEIGNGAMTQTAMNITEELACDWGKVRTEFAPVNRDYVEEGVYSVGFLPYFGGHGTDPVRMKYALQVGASARERLKAAAALHWGVPVEEVVAKNSVLTHSTSGRTLRYGDVAAAAVKIQLPSEPEIKRQSEWTFLGKGSPAKLNGPEIADGSATYGIDVKLPGMAHAALKLCPVHGGKLKSCNSDSVLNMPGVRGVVVLDTAKTKGSPVEQQSTFGFSGTETPSGVAVVADHYWQAERALAALSIEWDPGEGGLWESTEQIYQAAAEYLDAGKGRVMKKSGDVGGYKSGATVEASYVTPFCDHVVMEPLNGTALVSGDRVEVWHPCQDTVQAFWVAVDEAGVKPENVTVNQTYVGGGFGRRTLSAEVRVAVAIAREIPGVPVKVIWSREETTRQGKYRQLITSKFSAGLDSDGMPGSLIAHAVMAGATALPIPFGFSDNAYVASGAIPNAEMQTSVFPIHINGGAYRAPCYNSFAFMVETFIDECAVKAGIDPLEYRLKLLKDWDPAWSQCLNIAAERIGWGKALPEGEGMGIAISNWPHAGRKQAGATVCAAAHVQVSQRGDLNVRRIDLTFDCGRIANKDAVLAQLEGGIIFGLNMTLNEEITVRNGAVVEFNYHQYPMLRMANTPEINVHFDGLSGHDRFEIIGEAPVGPVGPAIGNAIFQATGKRLRSTPFRKHDLSWG